MLSERGLSVAPRAKGAGKQPGRSQDGELGAGNINKGGGLRGRHVLAQYNYKHKCTSKTSGKRQIKSMIKISLGTKGWTKRASAAGVRPYSRAGRTRAQGQGRTDQSDVRFEESNYPS